MATDSKNLKLCRVTSAVKTAFDASTPASGSVYWDETEKMIHVGDGSLLGGSHVGNEYIDVRDYGAKYNKDEAYSGVYETYDDDPSQRKLNTECIQDALDAAQTVHKPVYIPFGVKYYRYKLDTHDVLVIDDSCGFRMLSTDYWWRSYSDPSQRCRWIARRGFSACYPENTITSFQAAINAGAWAVETDLHVTSDGEIVLVHDAYINRVVDMQLGKESKHDWKYAGVVKGGTPTVANIITELNGYWKAAGVTANASSVVDASTGQCLVSSITLAQIKALDFGSYVDPSFSSCKVVTLDEFLAFCASKKVFPVIEFKGTYTEAFIASVCDAVAEYQLEKQVITWTNSQNNMIYFRKHNPYGIIGFWFVSENYHTYTDENIRFFEYIGGKIIVSVDRIKQEEDILDDTDISDGDSDDDDDTVSESTLSAYLAQVKALRNAGFGVYGYAVNWNQYVANMSLGVDMICGDYNFSWV